jgi:hypothetical protein
VDPENCFQSFFTFRVIPTSPRPPPSAIAQVSRSQHRCAVRVTTTLRGTRVGGCVKLFVPGSMSLRDTTRLFKEQRMRTHWHGFSCCRSCVSRRTATMKCP